MDLPRLSVALRNFSDLTAKVENLDPSKNKYEDLYRKRKHEAAKKAKSEGITIELLKEAVQSVSRNPCSQVDPEELYTKILKIVHQLVGTDASFEIVQETLRYLFVLLKDIPSVTKKEVTEMKYHFGSFPEDLPSSALETIQRLMKALPAYFVNDASNNETQKIFGCDIKFNVSMTIDEYNLDYISNFAEEKRAEEVSFSLESYKQQGMISEARKKENVPKMQNEGHHWLEKELNKTHSSESALPVSEVLNSLYILLSSEKSNEELQAELFDLLGFDCFNLIEKILDERNNLLASFNKKTVDTDLIQKYNKQPVYGCQVIVQSEEEKLMLKQMRKEERRTKESKSKAHESAISLDPVYLRNLRAASLISAQNTPILTPSFSKSSYVPVTYPNVYDSQAQAKLTPGFIAGNKMSLPDGFQRVNHNTYEEIIIPSCEKAHPNLTGRLIPISELDDIGRLAFKGMKSLNRIQSVVFNTAYHSNENLLICAPTGAGKTNIAMLSILSCLKQHIDNGIIQRDKFKIVYVAPMKALAAEMVSNFGKKLLPLGIIVKELTGDMQLTKQEIMQTQMLVTTPEKWDVVTRKSTGDVALTQIVKLLIIDEVHLLHGDRGPVLEALVARTIRQVETTQSMIRIVGLSATLPNYLDVARFLHVNPEVGLFYFDGRFRPVPLGQTFIGIKAMSTFKQMQDMDEVCYEKCLEIVRNGHQVMIFVHARNATVRTAMVMKEFASNRGHTELFSPEQSPMFGNANKQMSRSRNKQLKELFGAGFSIHHAGMLRADRSLVEKNFSDGLVRVLVCTATLAWGVNLPARAVIIKGTEIYDAKHGSFVDLGILDVMQIFGRAGRPQFDDVGQGIIITHHQKLGHYLSLLTNQFPIESSFNQNLTDNLNAEVCLGTVGNIDDAVQWLSYTYLYIRMRRNPHVYGINYKDIEDDPTIYNHRRDLIIGAAKALDRVQMLRFNPQTSYLHATDLGRTASHFYIKYDTIDLFMEYLQPFMMEQDIFAMVSKSHEFAQLKVRDDELNELDQLTHMNAEYPVAGGSENVYGKVNILLQTHISRGTVESFSLISDRNYVVQNMGRISRALFEIVLKRHWPVMALRFLIISKSIEKQIWPDEHPLRQFEPIISPEVLRKIEDKNVSIDMLRDMESAEIGALIHHKAMGTVVKRCAHELPTLCLEASIKPITRTVLMVNLAIIPTFSWNDRLHGGAESFWIWVEDPDSNFIYHYECFIVQKKQVVKNEELSLVFTIPVSEPLPAQYYVKAVSDRWLGSEFTYPISFKHLILPERHPPHTELLDLEPLPVSALNNSIFEQLYKFSHFNPIQTQLFHTVYHTDSNVLLGAPTGSGKTIIAELAIFRALLNHKGCKCIYIAPMKALVRERIEDWKERLDKALGIKVVELTGDVTPDINAISSANIIVTTPEKWDGISRSWQQRNYVLDVSLIIIDEIHLLGEDRGPVLEVIVSRTNFITAHTGQKIRIIGLSTAVANARDLADWLGIKQKGLYNFKPSVRPVPLQVHIDGFPGKHYCPRMATMNKPTFQAVKTHSPTKPVLVFVSSRRQTRMTALDLIAYLALEDNPRQWLHIPEHDMDDIISTVKDNNLKLTLAFGIGMHHAGLQERDRRTVEELFVNQKIQMLIATSTLAWGVNFPAHLVVIKGTEYFDGKTCRYVDFPVTDVLQMMGRAGRPQFDDHGVAVILVQDIKKPFYKKFLYEPFPVESSLMNVLPDHMNAEIVSGTIKTKQEAIEYITWTYFFRRLLQNPSYYQLDSVEQQDVNKFLSKFVDETISVLEDSYCVEVEEDTRAINATVLGRIASYYYLSHKTVQMFNEKLKPECSVEDLLEVLTEAHEYDELPVRHNEDNLNGVLAKSCPLEVNPYMLDSAHTKTHLLLQAHFSHIPLPIADYYTDLKSVLDQAIRIIQAMIDVVADQGWLAPTIQTITLLQMIVQGYWHHDSSLCSLPFIESHHVNAFRAAVNRFPGGVSLPNLMNLIHTKQLKNFYESLATVLRQDLDEGQIEKVFSVLKSLPIVDVKAEMKECSQQNEGRRIVLNFQPSAQRLGSANWIPVSADREYTISVSLQRLTPMLQQRSTKAIAPNFPKPKDEGWILILGNVEAQDLVALKKIGFVKRERKCNHNLVFYTPAERGRVVYTLYVFSDCYLGLDQQYDIHLEVQ